MSAGRTLLVTGVNGFVGGTVARAWQKSGGRVIGLVRSDSPQDSDNAPVRCSYAAEEIRDLVDRYAPDAIFHAVGTASVALSFSDPVKSLNANVEILGSVLEGVRRSRHRPRVLYPSSAAVYGEPERLPVSEGAPVRPLSPYGQHKAAAELRGREYAKAFDVPVAILRVFSLFGPYQRRLLIHELFEQFRDQPVVTLQGTGEETRDFLHEDDFAAMTLAVLQRATERFTVLNVASGQGTRIGDVARTIGRLLGTRKDIHFASRARPGDPVCWIADVGKVKALLGEAVPAEPYDFEGRLAATLRAWAADTTTKKSSAL